MNSTSAGVRFELLRPFDDPSVNEIIIEGVRNFWLVRADGKQWQKSPFCDLETLQTWVLDLARSNMTRLDPIAGSAGGNLEGGRFRWHCLLPPMAVDGPLVSVRRHRFESLTLDEFRMSASDRNGLMLAVQRYHHIIVAGPTGSGKTSLLAALIRLMPPEERVFLIESIQEIGAITPGVVRLTPRAANLEAIGEFGMARLLAESLRLLPDRLVIGEIRAGEASVLVDALRTGHHGVLATVHASSGREVVARITAMAGLNQSSWLQDLSSDLLVVCMQRGAPPSVRHLERLS